MTTNAFDKEHTIRCIDANKHNHETTSYYLMLSKMQKDGEIGNNTQYNPPTTRLLDPHSTIFTESVSTQLHAPLPPEQPHNTKAST